MVVLLLDVQPFYLLHCLLELQVAKHDAVGRMFAAAAAMLKVQHGTRCNPAVLLLMLSSTVTWCSC